VLVRLAEAEVGSVASMERVLLSPDALFEESVDACPRPELPEPEAPEPGVLDAVVESVRTVVLLPDLNVEAPADDEEPVGVPPELELPDPELPDPDLPAGPDLPSGSILRGVVDTVSRDDVAVSFSRSNVVFCAAVPDGEIRMHSTSLLYYLCMKNFIKYIFLFNWRFLLLIKLKCIDSQ